MERSYGALRGRLRAGAFVPGARLEANRLADELGVSVTPIRDALHQLVGERLVDMSIGEGFRVPRISEAELRDLYEWLSAILSMAVRTTPPALLATAVEARSAQDALADQTAELFERVASAVPNGELRTAILVASDRIHPFRMIEHDLLRASEAELLELARVDPAQSQALKRYHLRRMRVAPELVRRRDRR
jgi:DNA-binding GntR family transcriptional regulator